LIYADGPPGLRRDLQDGGKRPNPPRRRSGILFNGLCFAPGDPAINAGTSLIDIFI
jgi:hypothetical protein